MRLRRMAGSSRRSWGWYRLASPAGCAEVGEWKAEEKLGRCEASRYRAAAARANDLGVDGADL